MNLRQLSFAPLFAMCLTLGCTSDGTGDDGAGTAGTTGGQDESTGEGTRGGDPTSGGLPGSSTGADETGDASTGSDSGGTTGEAAGTCVGLTTTSHLGTVFELADGQAADLTCSAEPAGCGGDLTGTWNVVETCGFDASPNPLEDECPGSVFEVLSVASTGTVSFDGSTYTQAIESTLTVNLTFDVQACYMTSCAAASIYVNTLADTTGSCSGPDEACSCDLVTVAANNEQGTYETMGEQLTLTPSDGEVANPAPYCVEDARLSLWQPVYTQTPTAEPCDDRSDCEAALGDAYEAYACETAADGGDAAAPGFRLPSFAAR